MQSGNGKRKSYAVVDLTGDEDEPSTRPNKTQRVDENDSEDDGNDIIDLSQDFNDDIYRHFELYGMLQYYLVQYALRLLPLLIPLSFDYMMSEARPSAAIALGFLELMSFMSL